MVDTPSSILLLRLQALGSNTNLWGGYLNTAMQMIEQASKGYQTLAVTGDATISWTNYTTGNIGQCAHLALTGALSAAATLTFPGYQNWMTVHNNTGQTVTIKCSGGTGVAIPASRRAAIHCNGTDYFTDTPTWTGDTTSLLNNGDLVSYAQMAAAIAASVPAGTAGTIFNSAADTTRGYHAAKHSLSVSGAVTGSFSTTSPAGNENLLLTLAVGALGLTPGAAQTTSFAAAVNTRYGLTKSGAVTVTLPAAPSVGDIIQIEINGTSGLVTYALNGLKYYGSTSNPTSAQEGVQTFYYSGASRGWIDS